MVSDKNLSWTFVRSSDEAIMEFISKSYSYNLPLKFTHFNFKYRFNFEIIKKFPWGIFLPFVVILIAHGAIACFATFVGTIIFKSLFIVTFDNVCLLSTTFANNKAFIFQFGKIASI